MITKDSSQFKQIHEELQIHLVLGLNNKLVSRFHKDTFIYLSWFLDDKYELQPNDFEYQPYLILYTEIYNAVNK